MTSFKFIKALWATLCSLAREKEKEKYKDTEKLKKNYYSKYTDVYWIVASELRGRGKIKFKRRSMPSKEDNEGQH